jgi:hypothetical protein
MSDAFREISYKVFQRKIGIFKEHDREVWGCVLSVKNLLYTFDELDITFGDPPIPPAWSLCDNSLFGAYLAGIIDGDGDVRIKRKSYPQCAIRITSGKIQEILIDSVKKILNCGVSASYREKISELDGRTIAGHENVLEFYVSSKNYAFMMDYVIPYLKISYKKNKIENYINSKLVASVA